MALVERPCHVKNRDQLIDRAYGESVYVDDRTIDSHIKRLRKTFSSAGGKITINCEANQSHVTISIDEMGVRTPDPKLETIFGRFYSE